MFIDAVKLSALLFSCIAVSVDDIKEKYLDNKKIKSIISIKISERIIDEVK